MGGGFSPSAVSTIELENVHSEMEKLQPKRYGKVKRTPVPKVRLYVERPETGDWFVRVENVVDKGRWKTEAHAHPAFGQVIIVQRGRGVLNLEGSSMSFEGPCGMLIPLECNHALDYELDVDKWIVTIEASYLAHVNAKLPEFGKLWSAPRVIPLANSVDSGTNCCNLLRRLKDEAESEAVGHIIGTETLLTTFLLTLIREASLDEVNNEVASGDEVHMVARFRELIDKHYYENLALTDYTSMLAVSVGRLRAACAIVADQSPTKMIHTRIITEAKRDLIFSDMSVEQIAFKLGFTEATYFARFFRREVGQAPLQFRVGARH